MIPLRLTPYSLLLLLLTLPYLGTAQALMDGNQSEWSATTLIADEPGDVSGSELDIQRVHVTDDEDFVYFMVELDREINLDEEQDLTLYIDADLNADTGFFTQGIGTELTYFFAERFGFSEVDGTVNHDDLDLFIAPTVSSTWYEFALSKDSPGLDLTESTQLRCVITNGGGSSDRVGPFDYTMQGIPAPDLEFSFDRVPTADFRIVSYNVKFDGWFEPQTEDDQRNLIKALQPDIIAFQEIYDHSIQEIEQSLDEILPSQSGWNTIHNWSDVFVYTTHEVIGTESVDGNEVSLLKVNGEPLLIVNVHLPCCENDQGRQEEIDRILSLLRDRNTNGNLTFDFDQSTPTIITGDFNLVGDSQQYESLLSGDIIFNSTFGPDVMLDSDGSGLTDANLLQPHLPSNHTWYNQFSSFAPGKLDLFFYTDTSLSLENGFVMNSEGLANSILQEYNLSRQSTHNASDHIPIVGDFKFEVTVSTSNIMDDEIRIHPNPASQSITISLVNTEEVHSLNLYDLQGRQLDVPVTRDQQSVSIDISQLAAGLYSLKVITENQFITKSVVVQE